MQLPLPLLHIMRDIRMEQLEEQRKEMETSNVGGTPANAGVLPSISGDVDDLMEDLS